MPFTIGAGPQLEVTVKSELGLDSVCVCVFFARVYITVQATALICREHRPSFWSSFGLSVGGRQPAWD